MDHGPLAAVTDHCSRDVLTTTGHDDDDDENRKSFSAELPEAYYSSVPRTHNETGTGTETGDWNESDQLDCCNITPIAISTAYIHKPRRCFAQIALLLTLDDVHHFIYSGLLTSLNQARSQPQFLKILFNIILYCYILILRRKVIKVAGQTSKYIDSLKAYMHR